MQQRNYRALVKAITSDPSTSDWLRAAVAALEKRDPIDSAMDAAILAKLTDLRMTRVYGIQPATHVCLDTRADDLPGLAQRAPATTEHALA